MSGHYLRFTDESEAMLVLQDFYQSGRLIVASSTHSIDMIGSITTDAGTINEVGDVVVPPTVDSRYHVNFQGTLPAGLAPFEVFPVTPHRVWA